jgi:hypothetical protein
MTNDVRCEPGESAITFTDTEPIPEDQLKEQAPPAGKKK